MSRWMRIFCVMVWHCLLGNFIWNCVMVCYVVTWSALWSSGAFGYFVWCYAMVRLCGVIGIRVRMVILYTRTFTSTNNITSYATSWCCVLRLCDVMLWFVMLWRGYAMLCWGWSSDAFLCIQCCVMLCVEVALWCHVKFRYVMLGCVVMWCAMLRFVNYVMVRCGVLWFVTLRSVIYELVRVARLCYVMLW